MCILTSGPHVHELRDIGNPIHVVRSRHSADAGSMDSISSHYRHTMENISHAPLPQHVSTFQYSRGTAHRRVWATSMRGNVLGQTLRTCHSLSLPGSQRGSSGRLNPQPHEAAAGTGREHSKRLYGSTWRVLRLPGLARQPVWFRMATPTTSAPLRQTRCWPLEPKSARATAS